MDFNLSEWLNLAVRWIHVFAAILWVGQTFLFTWLDRRLTAEASLWMVHSGGFYVVEKQKAPDLLPQRLHWFRREALVTWLSGMALLIIVYYAGGLMHTNVTAMSVLIDVGIGLSLIAIAWTVYDFLWQSSLAKSETVGMILSYLLLAGVTFGLTRVWDGRSAYIHVGAMLGTLMTANVWMRILPFQRQMVAAAKQGKPPDASLAARARQRTKHNTYMVVPVVFIMVSNHFPVATYGNRYNWIILAILVLAGWGAAKAIRSAG